MFLVPVGETDGLAADGDGETEAEALTPPAEGEAEGDKLADGLKLALGDGE